MAKASKPSTSPSRLGQRKPTAQDEAQDRLKAATQRLRSGPKGHAPQRDSSRTSRQRTLTPTISTGREPKRAPAKPGKASALPSAAEHLQGRPAGHLPQALRQPPRNPSQTKEGKQSSKLAKRPKEKPVVAQEVEDAKPTPAPLMFVDLFFDGEGQEDKVRLTVNRGDSAREVARRFCEQHGFDHDTQDTLEAQLRIKI